MSETVKKGWNKYLLQIQLNPLRTKAITSGVLIGSSDIIAQKITGVKKLQFNALWAFVFGTVWPFLSQIDGSDLQRKEGQQNRCKEGFVGAIDFFSLEQYAFHDVLWRGS